MNDTIILGNRYQLEERRGSGGMAVVYRAQDLMLDRPVALKILRKKYSESPEFRGKFHYEAKAAAKLSHTNIVTVYDFGLDAGRLFIVMEYVPGTDLKTLLRQRGRLNIELAIDLILQACRGIGYAHRSGLVHCDVKPQNMLVAPDYQLKVVDFGIARALSSISPEETSEVVWGSPLYFSPEQASGQAPSPASDVYSLGVVLYEMLTGRLPFIASTPQELARLHREELPPAPRQFNPSIPDKVEEIILKVLSKEPAARYRTAEQLAHVLENVFPLNQNDTGDTHRIPTITGTTLDEARIPQSNQSNPVIEVQPEAQNAWLESEHSPDYADSYSEFDWLTWLLALLALLFVGGLIPFWLWVYYMLYPPL